MADYAHPEVLVSTEWVAQHLSDPKIRLVEVDVDTSAYDQGHIPGAIGWNWQSQLQDTVRRDLVDQRTFEELLSRAGITNDNTIVLYGDNNNWFAAWAFWQLKYYGHQDVRIDEWRPQEMDRGKARRSRRTRRIPQPPLTAQRHPMLRSVPSASMFSRRLEDKDVAKLVDVRSNDEFTGKVIAPPGMSETAQRGGHIPGAVNVPWAQAVNEDGTFKSCRRAEAALREKNQQAMEK